MQGTSKLFPGFFPWTSTCLPTQVLLRKFMTTVSSHASFPHSFSLLYGDTVHIIYVRPFVAPTLGFTVAFCFLFFFLCFHLYLSWSFPLFCADFCWACQIDISCFFVSDIYNEFFLVGSISKEIIHYSCILSNLSTKSLNIFNIVTLKFLSLVYSFNFRFALLTTFSLKIRSHLASLYVL